MDNDNVTYQVLTTNRATGTEMTIHLPNLGDDEQRVHLEIYQAYNDSLYWKNTILQKKTVSTDNIVVPP